MASQVILKKSSVAARVPVVGDLAYGELALNYADGLLYYKKSDGTTIATIGSAYTDTDTLAIVTGRGNTTTNAIKVGGKSTVGSGPLTGSATYTLAVGQSSSSNVPTIAFSTQVIGNAVPETVIAKLIALDTSVSTAMAGYASISLTSGIAGQLGKGQIVFHTSDETPADASTNTMTEKVRIAYNGYLGVGTPTPTQRLEVAGTIYSTSGGFKFPDGTTQATAATTNALTDSVANWAAGNSFSTGLANPTDVSFKPDGTKMFVSTGTTLNQYTLSTAWDVTTAGTVTSLTNTWDTVTNGMFVSPDGTKLVTCGQTAVVNAGLGIVAAEDRAYYLTLATPWDITTATLVSSLRFAINDVGLPAAETAPQSITFNSTGTIMYMLGSTVDAIYQYTLTTAYNVSTATYSKQLSTATVESASTGLRFNSAGTRLYIIGSSNDNIVEYRLSTAWDIATATYYDEAYIGGIESTSTGIYIDEISGNAYIVGTTNDSVINLNTSSAGILIAPALATGKIDLVGETRIKNASLYVNKNINLDGGLTVGLSIVASGNIVANQIATSTSSITLGGAVSTGATTLSTVQTTGTISIGGTAGTGAITLGQSTAAQTLNLGTGATLAATTKIINIGTTGVSTSVTNINYGSSVTGALNTHTWSAGANSMVMDASGNLGIGTTSPARKLDVNGPVRIADANVIEWGGTSTALVGSSSSNTMQFFTASSERMRLDSAGNLGIGTTSPDAKLTISQTASAGDMLTLKGANSVTGAIGIHAFSNGGVYLQASSTRDIRLRIGSTDHVTLDSSGNLGLGVTPKTTQTGWRSFEAAFGTGLLTYSGGPLRVTMNTYLDAGSLKYGTSSLAASMYEQETGAHKWLTAPSGTAGAAITFTQAMTLDASGNLLVGTTTSAGKVTFAGSGAASQTLTLNGTTTGANFARFKSTSADGVIGVESSTGSAILSGSSANATVLYTVGATALQFGTNSAVKATLDSSGNLGIGTTSPGAMLDVHANAVFAIRSLRNTGNGGLSSSDTAGGIRLGTSNGSTGYIGAAIDIQAPSTWTAGSSQPSDMRFFTVPSGSTTLTERMRLDSAGNLGIGQAVPTQKLEVAGTIYSTSGGFKFPDGTTQTTAAAGGGGSGTVTSVAALTLGTTGTDVTSTVATGTTTPVITLNIPTASAANRGALSAADWTTFNDKLSSYTETDTLATVTGRGATTSTAVTFNGGITGNLTGNASGLSAVLAVASGGTGTATPGLVQGTNVTITGTWPNQTINSTASGGTSVDSISPFMLMGA